MLASAGREDDCVEPVECDGCGRDRLGDPPGVDREREPGSFVSCALGCLVVHVRREPAESEQPGLVLERAVELVEVRVPVAQEVEERALGRSRPERVAIGSPSSGVKPIVVSTERPSRTAVTEEPPPR